VKILAKILLFFFLVAQAAPTIISMLDFEEEISLNIIEENEKSKEEKELKTGFIITESKSHVVFSEQFSNKIPNDFFINEYNTYSSIDLIPPKV
jgi:hypothetical protein